MKWYKKIPHPVSMLFGIIVLATLLSYILPAGMFERELMNGRMKVIPGSYKDIESTPIGIMGMFKAISGGFKTASDVIVVVFTGGIMFGLLEKTKMIENAIGSMIKTLGLENRYILVVAVTIIFGFLGIAVGYENNIALVPIAAVVSLAIGGDLILAAGMSIGAITVGFGLSPINPYTVGIGHQIADMPLFSGIVLRSILCSIGLITLCFYNIRYFKMILSDPSKSMGAGLNTDGFNLSKEISEYRMTTNNWLVLIVFLAGLGIMLYGIFQLNWYLTEISSMFLMIGIASGIVSRISVKEMSETSLKSVTVVAAGAFMVGFASTIKVLLEMGNIGDTIAFNLSQILEVLPSYFSAIVMTMAQSIMNILIPSGSGQALATLPIMLPVGELVGLTRQTTILAFQIGDGVTNLFNPSLGGLIAMLGICRVPFDRWLRFIIPIGFIILLISWLFLLFSVAINWGPA